MLAMITEKGTHLLHIVGTGATGLYAETMLAGINPSQVVTTIQVVTQLIIAAVTAYAAIRKTFQKPAVSPSAPAQDVQTES